MRKALGIVGAAVVLALPASVGMRAALGLVEPHGHGYRYELRSAPVTAPFGRAPARLVIRCAGVAEDSWGMLRLVQADPASGRAIYRCAGASIGRG